MPKYSTNWTREREREYQKAWRERNPDYMKQWKAANPDRQKKYKKANEAARKIKLEQLRKVDPIAYIKKTWKDRRKTKNREGHIFTITPDDLSWPTHCPVFGCELDYTGMNPISGWSIDQINPAMGYVPKNVQIISRRANTLKNNATIEELTILLDWLKTKTPRP